MAFDTHISISVDKVGRRTTCQTMSWSLMVSTGPVAGPIRSPVHSLTAKPGFSVSMTVRTIRAALLLASISFPDAPDAGSPVRQCCPVGRWTASRAGAEKHHMRLFQQDALPFAAAHPIIIVCSTNRKEVIRCRVISFSRTWPQRIALSGSSLPVKARDARRATLERRRQ
ncbi:hypothetical protein [Mesorhizobium helmanticense]|uniref:hypothetical protein n=1 Tax=Mesorhizobium helmanticense TaxID=1776423 RepID=UPI001FDFF526|nr:hypothetical protein [Mesorhizobium helmanticense]